MKWTLIGFVVVFGAATQAGAQFHPPSGGETAAVLKCFYACKEGPLVMGVPTFSEITTLMLTNQSPDARFLDVYYFDGREGCVAHSGIDLSSVDLDELNVCHTLLFGGLVPPPAGLVEIIVSDTAAPGTPGDGVYAWGKNVVGKFRSDNPEPFEGRVNGVGKYECRLVPDEVGAQAAVAAKCLAPVEVGRVLVEETAEPCSCDESGMEGPCPLRPTSWTDPSLNPAAIRLPADPSADTDAPRRATPGPYPIRRSARSVGRDREARHDRRGSRALRESPPHAGAPDSALEERLQRIALDRGSVGDRRTADRARTVEPSGVGEPESHYGSRFTWNRATSASDRRRLGRAPQRLWSRMSIIGGWRLRATA